MYLSYLVTPSYIVKVVLLRACFLNQTPCNRERTFHSWNSISFLYSRLGAWNKKVGYWFNYLQINIHTSLYIGGQHLVVTQILLLTIAKYRFLNCYFFTIVIINSVSSIPYYRFMTLTMLLNNSIEEHMKAAGRLLPVCETCLIFSTMPSKMDVAHCIAHTLPCFLQCKIIFKDVLKRIHRTY